jgi:hypothetical protein
MAIGKHTFNDRVPNSVEPAYLQAAQRAYATFAEFVSEKSIYSKCYDPLMGSALEIHHIDGCTVFLETQARNISIKEVGRYVYGVNIEVVSETEGVALEVLRTLEDKLTEEEFYISKKVV